MSRPRQAGARWSSLLLGLALVGCGGGGGGMDSGVAGDAAPADGAAPCVFDEECAGELVCAAGVCQRADCEPGSVGCVCGDGDRCGRGSDGEPLVCADSVCSSMSCPSGAAGCECLDGETCSDASSVCADGFCIPGDCEPGATGCSCLAGGCEVAAVCLDGALCVDDDGYEGGPCLEAERCHRGQLCDTTLDICAHCELGSEGCACGDVDTCSSGLACVAGTCVDGAALPPSDPVCYTPCRDDLPTETGSISCDSDGLLAGCVGDLECLEGSCVNPGESKPSCSTDLDCPSFQACLLGGCYSNCEASVDCSAGMGCHEKVCRVPCESMAGADTCGAGLFCDAEDGVNGYCVALADDSDAPPAEVQGGGFSLDVAQLAFSNVRTSRAFEVDIDDEDLRRHDFTVRKLWHEVTDASGMVTRVEADRDDETGELGPCDAVAGTCPLDWLDVTAPSMAASRDPEVTFSGFGQCASTDSCPAIAVSNAGGTTAVRWTGALEIAGNGGRATLLMTYVERPEGRWAGTMHYFGEFEEGGVEDWAASADKSNATGVANGLVRKWTAFRGGSLSGGWDEWVAVLTATRTESWTFGAVEDRCSAGAGACYPYTNSAGVRTYVTNLSATPIPRGVTELPFAINVRQPGLSAASLAGRIDSVAALHYPGDPSIALTLETDPSSADGCDASIRTDCVVWLSDLSAESVVGGRFYPEDGTCPAGFVAVDEPWLVEGFSGGSTADAAGRRSRIVCMDGELPYDTSSDATLEDRNRSLAGGNPVPDGLARYRSLRLLDGALINQTQLFVLFQETFDSFVDDGDPAVSAYGYLLLTKAPADIDETDDDGDGVPDAYQGNVPPTLTRSTPATTGATCDPDLLSEIVAGGTDLTALSSTELRTAVDVLLDGSGGGSLTQSRVHYYCEATGTFDGGQDDDDSAGAVALACPEGSRVVYFTTSLSQSQIAATPCQESVVCEASADDSGTVCTGGACQETLTLWRVNGIVEHYEPPYDCDDASTPYCDSDRLDLRAGKTFYSPPTGETRGFNALQADVAAAFRYRTRFTSSSGGRVGFAPKECIPDSDAVPYCYDPAIIEEVADRVDCLIAVYSDSALLASLDATRRSSVQRFLEGNFAQYADPSGARDGFERLYAELLVMQGDEALTRAFASRFDLAGVSGASFEGSLIEVDGIDLSGVPGFEMLTLHRAAQLYQAALDRLYGLGPDLSEALSRNASVDSTLVFLSAETVVLYLERLIRASTQKARAMSEIAQRYQQLNRPDLARAVVERAYTAAYLEAVVIQQLMGRIEEASTIADRAQIELTITQAQRRYRMALLDMRDVYGAITDDVNYFGFAPDYIPFPALDASALGRNAFEVLLEIARSKMDFARTRELEALSSNRSFQTDAATFQSELVRIRNTYENQLGDICGTFVSEVDGRVYPAIRKYASLDARAELLGDPCGRMGNGSVYRSLLEYQSSLHAQRQTQVRLENVFEEVDIERARASAQCEVIFELADYQFERAGEISTLDAEMATIRLETQTLNAEITAAADAAAALVCIPGLINECPTEAATGTITSGAAIVQAEVAQVAQEEIIVQQQAIADLNAETARWVTESECDLASIDSNARTAVLLLGLAELDLEALKGSWESRLLASETERLYHQAQRLQAQQEETEELLIDVESARNDPNVRVYRNDAIINADVAFQDALVAVFRATRVLEFYTSQSYPRMEQLFLTRMITAGDFNLENYVIELENSFFDFEETYGAPDTRVLQLSLMDDILQIPTLADDGTALTEAERYSRLRERVQDVDLLDANGYLSLGFATDIERLSPLTRNHKVLYIEAEIAGTAGDHVGRLYLRQAGTGVVRDLEGGTDYYVFPERTAVINPFFNGNRVFSTEVYQNQRLAGRPLVNTNWELVFNQRDELENHDIQLATLTDIRLYVYYSDFTAL